ncbi:unnamed protein product [Clavelina lepadiformis]|uniref:ZP domain-containing protein n=1 Tax=Clavelina lepadiformis TaxID=159417 RepID=A0ABP0H105_CLALP
MAGYYFDLFVLSVCFGTVLCQSSLDPDGSEFEIPVLGKDVNVTCGGNAITIRVTQQYLKRQERWLNGGQWLTLSDSKCKSEVLSTGDAVLTIDGDFTACGNKVTVMETLSEDGKFEATHYKFSNILKHNKDVGMVSRQMNLYSFECIYNAYKMTSTVSSQVDSRVIQIQRINGEMEFYENSTFYEPYRTMSDMALDDILYVQVSVLEPSTVNVDEVTFQFVTVIDTCWITTIDEKNALIINMSLITDGCAATGDVNVLQNSQTLNGRFSVKVLPFITHDTASATIHCLVKICNQTDNAGCIPTCKQNRKKRSLDQIGETSSQHIPKKPKKEVQLYVQSNVREIVHQFLINEGENGEIIAVDFFEPTTPEVLKNVTTESTAAPVQTVESTSKINSSPFHTTVVTTKHKSFGGPYKPDKLLVILLTVVGVVVIIIFAVAMVMCKAFAKQKKEISKRDHFYIPK